VVMPREWMEAGHAWLSTGEMPKGPVFDSVMRQVSFTYGLHGVALWIIASDVVRYRPLVVLTAVGYLLAAPVFLVIDLGNGMPWLWMAGNSGGCLLVGALLAQLLWAERSARRAGPLLDAAPPAGRDRATVVSSLPRDEGPQT